MACSSSDRCRAIPIGRKAPEKRVAKCSFWLFEGIDRLHNVAYVDIRHLGMAGDGQAPGRVVLCAFKALRVSSKRLARRLQMDRNRVMGKAVNLAAPQMLVKALAV